jgi:hypothetical protein
MCIEASHPPKEVFSRLGPSSLFRSYSGFVVEISFKYMFVLLSSFISTFAKCGEVLQCSGSTSNKVSNFIRGHIDNRKLLLICILILSCSLGYTCFQYMVVFLFNTVIYVFLLLDPCILIVRLP